MMKKIFILLFCLMNFLGCTSPRGNKGIQYIDQVKVISISEMTGEQESFALIFSDSLTLEQMLDKGIINEFRGFVDVNTVSRSHVSKPGLNYLLEFINNNCNNVFPIKKGDKELFSLYTVKIISEENIQDCYLYLNDIDLVKTYFINMKKSLEHSPYKKEFDGLISYLDKRIKYLDNKK